jgi:anthranilate phosphoribosyltransferase
MSDAAAGSQAVYSVTPHLDALLECRDLEPNAAADLMEAIVAGRVPPASVAAVAVALRMKGESVEELAAFAAVMRRRALQVHAPPGTLDTCGTGGDRSRTFNISTTTALVVAGMGIPVAKHGGRSITSTSGSPDVLKALGVNADVPPACVERCIREAGIGFMFAPTFHPGMRHVAPVRRELGVRTMFNLLGPLSNPANAAFQLLGVFDPALCSKFAEVLKQLGSRSAMVVCGVGPGGGGVLDEVSIFGPTTIARLSGGKVVTERFCAADLKISVPAADALRAGTPEESAKVVRGVLECKRGPARDIVVLNAAAAAIVAGKAENWGDGLKLAEQSLDEGKAKTALDKLIVESNR